MGNAAKTLAAGQGKDYPVPMDTMNLDAGQPASPETAAERQARIAGEAEGIARADAELDAGLYVDAAEVRAWIDSLRTNTPLPPPPTRQR